MSKSHRPCSAHVYTRTAYVNTRCSRNGKYEEQGKWYCKQHLPSEVQKRIVASDIRYKAKNAAKKAEQAAAKAEKQVLQDVMAWSSAKGKDAEEKENTLRHSLNILHFAETEHKQKLKELEGTGK